MTGYSKYAVECQKADEQMRSDACPALILDKKIMCDARKVHFEPCRRMIRESCTNEQHKRCPLHSTDAY